MEFIDFIMLISINYLNTKITLFILIGVIGSIITSYIQKKRTNELVEFKNNKTHLVDSNRDNFIVDEISNLHVDTYLHPGNQTSNGIFALIAVIWLGVGIIIPFFLLDSILRKNYHWLIILLFIISISSNYFWYRVVRKSIIENKNKIYIYLYNTKISFVNKDKILLFEVPFIEITDLRIEVKKGTSVYSDEFLHIDLAPNFVNRLRLEWSQKGCNEDEISYLFDLLSIQYYDSNYWKSLTGINNTKFKDEILKNKYNKIT